MKHVIMLRGKSLALAFVLVALFVAAQGVARADEVTVSGTTLGNFNNMSSNTLLGLTYNSSFFNATTSNGFVVLNNAPNPELTNFNNLGSITLDGPAANYNGNTFTLRVQLNAPGGIVGGNVFTLTGNISSTTGGGVFIDFDNTPRTFSFMNDSGSGLFTFSVGDVTVLLGGTVAITSTFTVPGQVPEPATITLLTIGLATIGTKLRRKAC